MSASLTVVVINWRLEDDTIRCLQSLEQLDYDCRVLVIDNGSGDGSAECFTHRFPWAEVIALPQNIGFGAACNLAIRRALEDEACEFVFLLNNDAVVHPTALSELARAALENKEAGILGPKTYFMDKPRTIWSAGARRRRIVLAAAETGCGQEDNGQYDMRTEVDYVFGTAMLIRREVFERTGFFDERFFMYLEDLDFCLRTQKDGFSLRFVPNALVWHKGSASTENYNGLRRYHLVRSTIYFLKKHASPSHGPALFFFWSMVSLREILSDIAHGKMHVMLSYWRGLIDGLEVARKS